MPCAVKAAAVRAATTRVATQPAKKRTSRVRFMPPRPSSRPTPVTQPAAGGGQAAQRGRGSRAGEGGQAGGPVAAQYGRQGRRAGGRAGEQRNATPTQRTDKGVAGGEGQAVAGADDDDGGRGHLNNEAAGVGELGHLHSQHPHDLIAVCVQARPVPGRRGWRPVSWLLQRREAAAHCGMAAKHKQTKKHAMPGRQAGRQAGRAGWQAWCLYSHVARPSTMPAPPTTRIQVGTSASLATEEVCHTP